MDDIRDNVELVKAYRGFDAEIELSACRKLLGMCQAFLPNGWLHDTVRLVAEGGSAEAAWEAIEEMTR